MYGVLKGYQTLRFETHGKGCASRTNSIAPLKLTKLYVTFCPCPEQWKHILDCFCQYWIRSKHGVCRRQNTVFPNLQDTDLWWRNLALNSNLLIANSQKIVETLGPKIHQE